MSLRRDSHTIGAAAFKAGNLKPEWPHAICIHRNSSGQCRYGDLFAAMNLRDVLSDTQLHIKAWTFVQPLLFGRRRLNPGWIEKVTRRSGGEVLTTQLYFPGEPANRDAPIFDAGLLMDVRRTGPARRATFTFVLP
jgi:hypothetical protein